jgi:hypothetical protein
MNEYETNEASKRTPIVASSVEHLGPRVSDITYEALGGAETSAKVPREAVEVIHLPDERVLCIVSEMKTSGGTFRPSFVFKGAREPAQPSDEMSIELVDMVQQGAATKNIRDFLDTQRIEKASAPTTEIEWVDDTEGIIGVSDVVITLESENTVVVEAGDDTPEWVDDKPAWDGSLLAGGRLDKTAPWDFTPQFLPNHIVIEGEAIRVNKKNGSAASWTVLNPLLQDEKRPAGALLGSVSDRYYTLSHPKWVNPILKYAKMSSIKTSVTSWNEGAKCRVDLDVTDAKQIRKDAADAMRERGGNFLDTNSLSEASQALDGLYKFGFTINNSLDGRASFGTYGSALRVYCQNLAVAGGIKNALNLRHTKGVMKDIDWDEFALNLVTATAELNEWLVNTEMMSWIPMELQMMDRLLFVMNENGLMTAPRLVKNKETGLITQVNRSHMDLAVTQGWKEPTLSYVAVQGEQKNTLYHALQCFTGAITHKPTVYDDKRELKGSTLGFDTLDTRLKKVNATFSGIAETTLRNAMEGMNNGEKLTLEQKDEVREFLKEYPEAIGGHGTSLKEVPLYTEAHEISVL